MGWEEDDRKDSLDNPLDSVILVEGNIFSNKDN